MRALQKAEFSFTKLSKIPGWISKYSYVLTNKNAATNILRNYTNQSISQD